MDFEWDERNRLSNIEKHGIDFIRARLIFDGPVIVKRSSHSEEERWIATGRVHGRYVTVIYAIRGRARRLISARKARDEEKKQYRSLHETRTR